MPDQTPVVLMVTGLAGFCVGVLLTSSSTIDITRILGFTIGMASFPVFGFGFAEYLSKIDTTTS